MSRASRALLSLVLALAPVLALALPARAADVSVQLGAGDGFAVKNNTASTDRLRVDEATGNLSRNGALFVHTTGTYNLFVGPGAGNTGTSGYGRNVGFGPFALSAHTTGIRNSAFGSFALQNNTTGTDNAAFGSRALSSNTGGANSAFGSAALRQNTTASFNSAFGSGALYANTTGTYNAAFGANSLVANTTGSDNSAFGGTALNLNTTGNYNSAFGRRALRSNTTGANNSAFGGFALLFNNGSSNSAFGFYALRSNTTGANNAAVGNSALSGNTTGTGNVAMGIYAGQNQTTGSNNIYLANQGVAAESGQIKIGTVGTHTQATIAGIHGATSTSGIAVLVNASGVLGTTTSSARFKEHVRDMGDASDVLMRLRPVTFRYREEVAEGGDLQYGLIAEEVAEVAPELVASDLEGRPYSVRYHVLPALLVNELQEQQRTIETLRGRVEGLEKQLASAPSEVAR